MSLATTEPSEGLNRCVRGVVTRVGITVVAGAGNHVHGKSTIL